MHHFDPPISFRQMQVLSDLNSAAVAGFNHLLLRLGQDHEKDFRRIVFEQECKLSERDTEQLHGALMMIASMPDQDHCAFMTATIVLLADRLQNGAGQDDLFWNWDAFQERFKEAPSPIRAALMNGFRTAHRMKLVTLDHPPTGGVLNTYDEADLIRLLKIVARSMSDDLRYLLCELASVEIRSVHRTALENCLRSNCILSEFGGWFPSEVVEKASLDTTHPAYAACTALLLIDAISSGDAGGKMAHRYEELAEEYFMMKTEVRAPLAAGLRHLHEMEADWEPYAAWNSYDRLHKAIVMPFAKP